MKYSMMEARAKPDRVCQCIDARDQDVSRGASTSALGHEIAGYV